ncbi:Mechanosensitive ion channel-domain-containing protein [Fimicolochytrium jonesii]|uniref:Mechanosensitive ion channel-domain-containing protein n=1 Tax=Fimicolochytrium jonesii TaxID=1396493 RepID=UPI0022FDCDF8|nr:Mechanosensitive ion channel-domain-containing protein [Fimicolochytrium jonesii]KAI8822477.1 Mechanosensitive ion channel-domain-containing protein [Fimicolochytrium jonesii]
MVEITPNWQQVLIPIGAVLIAWIVHIIVFLTGKWVARQTPWPFDDDLVNYSKWPLFTLFPVIAILITISRINISPDTYVDLHRAFMVMLILSLAFYACNMVRLAATTLQRAQNVEAENNLHARVVHTQIQVFKRLCYGFILIIALACCVFTFPTAWQIGASLLASAGVMGIVLGIAAKPILENTLASFIIAITQPILLDDEVVIDGEYGRIEGVHSMYIVVRTWDARRLIIPLARVFQSSFENWSRRSPWKIGTAYVYFDPSVPMADIRTIFTQHVLPTSGGLWDGKVANCAVTDVTTDGWLQIRFLASARDPSKAFDLRCHIREKIIEEVGRRYPWALVRRRVEVVNDPFAALEKLKRQDSGLDDVCRAGREPLRNLPISAARPLRDETTMTDIHNVVSDSPTPMYEKDYFDGLARGDDGGGHHGS